MTGYFFPLGPRSGPFTNVSISPLWNSSFRFREGFYAPVAHTYSEMWMHDVKRDEDTVREIRGWDCPICWGSSLLLCPGRFLVVEEKAAVEFETQRQA